MVKRREDFTPRDMAEARAVPGRWVARTRLDAVAELLRQIIGEAGGDGEVIGSWAREALAMLDTAPPPANLPSSAWMEAIARTAANAALLARHFHDADEAVEVGVRAAMQTPPPAGPGGPNDRPAA